MRRLGVHADDDEDGDCNIGGSVQEAGVSVDERSTESEVADRIKDIAMTFVVAGCIVSGCLWTGWRFAHGEPGTSHLLYTLAKAYPGVVLLIGVWFGVCWREWSVRHPWWLALAAFMLGHAVFPIWPW